MHGTFDHAALLQTLAEQANAEAELADDAFHTSIAHAIRCGELLIQAKQLIRHGEWDQWQRQHFTFKPRTARAYMSLAKLDPAKRQRVANLPLRAALHALGRCHRTLQSEEFYTPGQYVEAARRVLGSIDLDPGSCPEANATVRAAKFYSREDDGLNQPWHGNVWCNPPYGGKAGQFVKKLVQEYQAGHVTSAIVLLNAYHVDVHWFQQLWDGVLCFTNHRIEFYDGQLPYAGMVFVYLGAHPQRFAHEFAGFGPVVARWVNPP